MLRNFKTLYLVVRVELLRNTPKALNAIDEAVLKLSRE